MKPRYLITIPRHTWWLGRFSLSLIWEPRDLWVGLYWDQIHIGPDRILKLYLGLIPMLPLQLTLFRPGPDWPRRRRRPEHLFTISGKMPRK